MKIKITRANGTIIEAAGTVKECERLLAAEPSAPAAPPVYVWSPFIAPTYPTYVPQWTYTSSEINIAPTSTFTLAAASS